MSAIAPRPSAMTIDLIAAFDELERRRREETAAFREWMVRVMARQAATITPRALPGTYRTPHDGDSAPDLLTKHDVAKRLGITVRTVERRIASGALCAVREGHTVKVRRADFESYIANLEVAS